MKLSTPVLALAAAAALALDLSVAAGVAVGDDGAVETPVPIELPPTAFLTGEIVRDAELGGLHLGLEAAHGRYTLVLTNPGAEPLRFDAVATVLEQSGVSIGRMGPRTAQVAQETVVASVAPGESVRYTLAWVDPQAGAPEPVTPDPFSFRSIRVTLAAASADGEVPDLVSLVATAPTDGVAEVTN